MDPWLVLVMHLLITDCIHNKQFMSCKVRQSNCVLKCQQVIYSPNTVTVVRATTKVTVLAFWENKLSIKEPRAPVSGFTVVWFIHSTATTGCLGDIINNVDYTIKHRGARKERKQLHAVNSSKKQRHLTYEQPSLLEPVLLCYIILVNEITSSAYDNKSMLFLSTIYLNSCLLLIFITLHLQCMQLC